MIRVLIASRRGGSGIRTYTDYLAAGLAALSHDVFVLDETSGTAAPGVIPFARSQRHLGPWTGWPSRGQVLRHARELEVNVVHVTNLELAPRFDPVVVTAWDPVPGPVGRYRLAAGRGERPRSEAAFAIVDAVACRRAAAIIAVTPEVARGVRVFCRQTNVIPPFVPDSTVRPTVQRGAATVAMVANGLDMPRKGLRLALDAMKVARETRSDLRLALIGSWASHDAATSMPSWCDVVGHMHRADLAELFPSFGCLIVPSLWEEFSYVALEALAAGVPVTCAPNLGLAALSGGGIFSAEERSPEGLARQLLRALAVDRIEFPSECLASNALRAIERIYSSSMGQ